MYPINTMSRLNNNTLYLCNVGNIFSNGLISEDVIT